MNKIHIAFGALASLPIIFFGGKFLGEKNCQAQIDLAIEAAQTDFQFQLEQANLQSQKVVIKTIKQNENIKKAVRNYDVIERTRLLAQIENFEAGR